MGLQIIALKLQHMKGFLPGTNDTPQIARGTFCAQDEKAQLLRGEHYPIYLRSSL